jgi:hypothetical protein
MADIFLLNQTYVFFTLIEFSIQVAMFVWITESDIKYCGKAENIENMNVFIFIKQSPILCIRNV